MEYFTFPKLRINHSVTDNVIGFIAIYKETLF